MMESASDDAHSLCLYPRNTEHGLHRLNNGARRACRYCRSCRDDVVGVSACTPDGAFFVVVVLPLPAADVVQRRVRELAVVAAEEPVVTVVDEVTARGDGVIVSAINAVPVAVSTDVALAVAVAVAVAVAS
jgi:hypothetical protein